VHNGRVLGGDTPGPYLRDSKGIADTMQPTAAPPISASGSGSSFHRVYHLVRSWLWLLVLVPVLAGAATYAATRTVVKPLYSATSTLEVQLGQVGSDPLGLEITAAQQFAQTEVQLIDIPPVARLAYKILNLKPPFTPDGLLRITRASNPPNSTLIYVSATSGSPTFAARVATAMAQAASQVESQHQKQRFQASFNYNNAQIKAKNADIGTVNRLLASHRIGAGAAAGRIANDKRVIGQFALQNAQLNTALGRSGTQLQVWVTPTTPKSPVSPRPVRDAGLAALLALLVTAGFVYLGDYLRTTLDTPEEVSRVLGGVPVLGAIARLPTPGSNEAEKVVATHPRAPTAEAYRVVRTALLFSDPDRPPRTILVTSSKQAEGKTTTAVNLAATLAELGGRVLLLDCDLRRPSLHKVFDIDYRVGLTTALIGDDHALEQALRPSGYPNLYVMTSGPLPPNPSELLSAHKMSELIERLEQRFEHIVIDSPPLLPVADASVLSRLSDAVLLVVDVATATRHGLGRAGDSLTRVGTHITGVVLNKLVPDKRSGYYYYYYQGGDYVYRYGPRSAEEENGRKGGSGHAVKSRETAASREE